MRQTEERGVGRERQTGSWKLGLPVLNYCDQNNVTGLQTVKKANIRDQFTHT